MRGVGDADPCTDPDITFLYKFRQCAILNKKHQEEILMNVNDPRWASIDAFVEENRDNILRDITRLVAVPSVEGAPEPSAPFGPGPKAALAKALEIAAAIST